MTLPWISLNNGNKIPALLYGTAWKKELTADYVQQALNAGFRGIDTACQPKHYNEPGVGDGIATYLEESSPRSQISRADLYLQTKFTPLSGQDPKRVPYDAKAPFDEQVRQSVQASLRNLRTHYLDSLVLHSAVDERKELATIWSAMEACVEAEYVKQLGISNCHDVNYLQRLHQSARIKPVVVQNRFYEDSGYDKSLRKFCRSQGIVYQSFWTLTANGDLLSHATITTLSKHYLRTPAQILFRYLTQEGIVPLTGTKLLQHLREDLTIFEFELTDDERTGITALL
jgi:diketogulonate reductase-like aldo/keto reductase